MCNDVISIVAYNKEKKAAVKKYLETECTPKEGRKLPWQKQEYDCPTSTLKTNDSTN